MANTLIPYDHLPELSRDDVRLLWHSDFWDGPINGLCEFGGRRCWFETCAEGGEDEPFYRRFLVLDLTAEQLADEERWHELFREAVGTHTDYDGEGRTSGQVHPGDAWASFYDAYAKRPKVDYTGNHAVGWFESS